MSRSGRRRRGHPLGALVLAAALGAAAAAQAKTTGVAEDAAVQSGPCYDALVDKNAANPTTAPNRELGAACQAEHGDVDKAWARVIRLWGSDSVDLPDYDSYRPVDAPAEGTMPLWLASAGLLLTYAAIGVPVRAAARLMGVVPAPAPAPGAPLDTVLCLAARALVAAALVALLGLPVLAVACGLALVAWLAVAPAAPRPGVEPVDGPARPLARHLAAIVNDGLGAAASLAALALFARNSLWLFAAGIALALVISAGPVIAGRRPLRSTRWGRAASRALLAAAVGEVLVVTPPVSAWLGGLTGAALLAPLVLAALTFAGAARAAGPSTSPTSPA